jgi:hypothetical protein
MLRRTLVSFVPEEHIKLALMRTWNVESRNRLTGQRASFSLRSLSCVQRHGERLQIPMPQPFLETFLVRNASKRLVPLALQAFALRLLCGVLPTRHMLHRHDSWPDKYPASVRRPFCLLCDSSEVLESTWHLFADCPKAIQGGDSPLRHIASLIPEIHLMTSGILRSATDAQDAQVDLLTLLSMTNNMPGDSLACFQDLSAVFDPVSGAEFPAVVAMWNHVFAAVGLFPAPVFQALQWQQAACSRSARRWLRRCTAVSTRLLRVIWRRRNEVLLALLDTQHS